MTETGNPENLRVLALGRRIREAECAVPLAVWLPVRERLGIATYPCADALASFLTAEQVEAYIAALLGSI